MEELTIEQKAKRYDEILVKLQEAKVDNNVCDDRYCCVIEDIVPELAESEDERIKRNVRVAIEHHFSSEGMAYKEDMDNLRNECLAWLEEQGELKSAEWSEDDEAVLSWCISDIERAKYCMSQTKPELCDIEINWLKNIKDRVQPQPKQEWNEEDKQLYNDLSDTYFYNDEDYPEETYKLMLKRVLDWMTKRAKSLRPQSTWKPSDEQMKVLCLVKKVQVLDQDEREILNNLYKQLKKL